MQHTAQGDAPDLESLFRPSAEQSLISFMLVYGERVAR